MDDYISDLTSETSGETIHTDSDVDIEEENYLYNDSIEDGQCVEEHDDKYVCDYCYRKFLRWMEDDEKKNHQHFIDDSDEDYIMQ